MTSEADRILLLRLAREAIAAHLYGRPAPTPAMAGVLARHGGGFVTLLADDGSLRGCIGHVGDDEPLGQVVSRCAVAAASDYPRFSTVSHSELSTLQIEVSRLGELEAGSGPAEIEIGRHGLVVERGRLRGVLLPQVATEWRWDVETFLAHACRKAGLRDDAWKNDATLWRFEAEVFGEGR